MAVTGDHCVYQTEAAEIASKLTVSAAELVYYLAIIDSEML